MSCRFTGKRVSEVCVKNKKKESCDESETGKILLSGINEEKEDNITKRA